MPLVELRETHDICMTWATPYKEIGIPRFIAEEDGLTLLRKSGVVTSKQYITYARWTNQSAAGTNRILSPLVALHFSL